MNSVDNSTNPTTTPPDAEVFQQLQEVRRKIDAAQRGAAAPLELDIGLDADLLAAFNAGVSQPLVLLIQIVRLLRQRDPAPSGD